MKNKGMRTALAAISLLALASIFGYSQNTAEFHIPQNMGSPINLAGFSATGGAISPNGLSFYFTSNGRPGGLGLADIWVSKRLTLSSAWGEPQNLGATINTASTDNRPKLSLDGRTMFFGSNRDGSFDIFMSTRTDPNDDFGWTTPVSLGVNVNTPDGSESTPAYFEDPITGLATLYFASNRVGGFGDFDIYQSTRNSNGTFNPAVNFAILNSPGFDAMPFLSRDGLEIYLASDNGGLGLRDIWVSKRSSLLARWSRPANVGTVNSEYDELDPSLSPDGSVLYFSSTRDGGSGGQDLYSATRLCIR